MLIQSHYNQKGTFERIIRSRDGQLVRIFFEVYEIGGEFKGRILRAEPILALAKGTKTVPHTTNRLSGNVASACVLLLCAPSEIVSPYFWNIEKKITSPFSICNLLTSIKIRAPSL